MRPAGRLARLRAAALKRGGGFVIARSERLVGRFAIAAIVVGSLLGLNELLLPGDHVDVLWIAMIAAILVTAVVAGFVPSVITAFVAAAAIDVWLLEPRGTLLVSSAQDAIALALFLAVALIGASAASRPRGASSGAGLRDEAGAAPPEPLIEPLTGRELEFLALLGRGLSNGEIARELVVSNNTVKTHLEHLYGKLAVPSRGRAVAEGRRRGLLIARDDRITRSGDRPHHSG